MSTPDVFDEDLMLAEAARMDLVLARRLHEKAMTAEDVDEIGSFTRAYVRATRSMRQCLALLSRVKTERAKAAREEAQHEAWMAAREAAVALKDDADPWPAPDPDELAHASRVTDLQTAVSRMSWAVADKSRNVHTAMVHRFDRELDDWWDQPDFLDFELEPVVRHAARVLGLPRRLADRWRELPDPPYDPEPAPAQPRAPDHRIHWPPGESADTDAGPADAPDVPVSDSA
ncbi:hypothetical protein [Phenylobacterium sp.]|uniref:hypothetical protein n=1 Tax=Phenylobacterium sp. TaxID=1871053 RepID=UPI003D271552